LLGVRGKIRNELHPEPTTGTQIYHRRKRGRDAARTAGTSLMAADPTAGSRAILLLGLRACGSGRHGESS